MFRLIPGFDKKGTFKPVKHHASGSKREMFSAMTTKTLGSGNMRGAVVVPPGEDLNEWLAVNTVDFFNAISCLWGMVCDNGVPVAEVRKGFPPSFEYSWADGVKVKKPVDCSGPQYVDYVMSWVEDITNNNSIFPSSPDIPFPKDFLATIKQIFTRMFRIIAIIYAHHYNKLEELGAVAHLNTSCKHFLYFMWEFDLVNEREFGALPAKQLKDVREKYENEKSSSS